METITRTGLDWSDKYPAVNTALRRLEVRHAYLDVPPPRVCDRCHNPRSSRYKILRARCRKSKE
jgi:hypothetical protein